MLDISVSYNRYKFLGNEFLTWLWFMIEKDQAFFKKIDNEFAGLEIGDKIVFENRRKDSPEVVSIKGDNAGREEGKLSLQKGSMVTELNLLYRSGPGRWRFSLKGESFGISGLKTPEGGRVETEEEMEGAILEKIFLIDKVLLFFQPLFSQFARLRVSGKWQNDSVPMIKKWITSTD